MKKTYEHRDIQQDITNRIIAELENGTAPWVKPWRSTAGHNVAANAVTKRPYSGVNVILLWMAMSANGWTTPRFLTFKQAKEAGGTVRGGEKGTSICFMKRIVGKDKVDPEKLRQFSMLRGYTVFNIAQCDGLPEKLFDTTPAKVRNPDQRDELIDAFVASTGADIRYGHGEACYRPGVDNISMPSFESFKNADTFYCTLNHELVHWTGIKSRCDRDLLNRFGDARYAAEELVAELGTSFICAEFGIDVVSHNASYIASWIKLLKSDNKAIFTAAAKAQEAVNFLRGLALKDEDDGEGDIALAA